MLSYQISMNAGIEFMETIITLWPINQLHRDLTEDDVTEVRRINQTRPDMHFVVYQLLSGSRKVTFENRMHNMTSRLIAIQIDSLSTQLTETCIDVSVAILTWVLPSFKISVVCFFSFSYHSCSRFCLSLTAILFPSPCVHTSSCTIRRRLKVTMTRVPDETGCASGANSDVWSSLVVNRCSEIRRLTAWGRATPTMGFVCCGTPAFHFRMRSHLVEGILR